MAFESLSPVSALDEWEQDETGDYQHWVEMVDDPGEWVLPLDSQEAPQVADLIHLAFAHIGLDSPRVASGEHPVPFRRRLAVRANQAATCSDSALEPSQALSAALSDQLGVPDLKSYGRAEQRRS